MGAVEKTPCRQDLRLMRRTDVSEFLNPQPCHAEAPRLTIPDRRGAGRINLFSLLTIFEKDRGNDCQAVVSKAYQAKS